MTAPTFTPGPWRRVGHRAIAAGAGLNAVTVCEVFSGGVGLDQADGNEALIAAAPELHAAAAEVFAWIDCGFRRRPRPTRPRGGFFVCGAGSRARVGGA